MRTGKEGREAGKVGYLFSINLHSNVCPARKREGEKAGEVGEGESGGGGGCRVHFSALKFIAFFPPQSCDRYPRSEK